MPRRAKHTYCNTQYRNAQCFYPKLAIKILRVHNLWNIDMFHSKLVPFLLSVLNRQAWTNTPAYYRIRTLRIHNVFYQNDISIKSSNVKLNINDVCNLIER